MQSLKYSFASMFYLNLQIFNFVSMLKIRKVNRDALAKMYYFPRGSCVKSIESDHYTFKSLHLFVHNITYFNCILSVRPKILPFNPVGFIAVSFPFNQTKTNVLFKKKEVFGINI